MRKNRSYCGRWFDLEDVTPMYEKNKPHVVYYCDLCLPDVKSGVRGIAHYHLFKFGQKGS